MFGRPASPQVAQLLGIENLRSGRTRGPGRIEASGSVLEVAERGLPEGTHVVWCVRPQHVGLGGEGGHSAAVRDVANLGAWIEVAVELDGGLSLIARTLDGDWLRPGERCRVEIAPEHVTLWPAQ